MCFRPPELGQIQCPECGQPISPMAKLCLECGADVSALTESARTAAFGSPAAPAAPAEPAAPATPTPPAAPQA